MQHRSQFRGWSKALSVLLLFALAISGTAFAAHFHPLDQAQDTHCQMCLLAHHSAVPTPHVELSAARTTVAPVPVAVTAQVVSRPALSARIRPPPVSL